ncbi:YtpI family protein [Metabacillus fastidiosus]|uniref:YtpI family protein n=2 Tax=Metabacillus fastidiosus TaxID=1458 RepID=A0ABU6NVN6_9BACI|nr:YtpI family protein [Metabacillus fastidiosus]MED4401195.1 YtpI family protein [Metabacillus fastidiosus]MED4453227.1 YtpI family protein [Metabacillus fastidiosus]MED4464122.1 YtpI family protein [Metabacillus fastidiosus]MED4531005.1 YtpI family protein [Metabacillus fastidiosus]
MLILVIAIAIFLVLYLFYKAQQIFGRKKPMEKQWISAKASICLSLFVLTFGLNQLLINHSTVTLVVGIFFVIFGLASSWASYRKYKYYLPLAQEEVEKN